MGATATIAAVVAAGSTGAILGSSMAKKPETVMFPTSADVNDEANENEAQKVAERRRRMYANVGRSSTILTGPSGLGGLGTQNNQAKTLLGM